MSDLSGPPFRADHVGSLLRPPRIAAAREDASGRPASRPPNCAGSRMRRSATSSRCRRRSGLDGVTDGEFRRGSWHMDFLYQIGGVTKIGPDLDASSSSNEAGRPSSCSARRFRIRRQAARSTRRIFGEDFAFLQIGGDRRRRAEADHPVAER